MPREISPAPDALPDTRRAAGSAPGWRDSAYIGRTLDDRYLILGLLGRGGMGRVFLGKHVSVGRPVAVKILDCGGIPAKEGCERLFREARAAAAIGHPSIIDVLDVGTTPFGDPYLAMEYLEGEDLASLTSRTGRLSVAAACGVFEPILQALQVAHGRGVIHRDLKPANILLVRREGSAPVVKLIDFGISKLAGTSEQAKITAAGVMLGTPAYMAPEQVRGADEVDERADLYAVGVMLYEVVVGRLPLESANYNDLVSKILNEQVKLPPASADGLPEDFVALVQRALSRDPADRPQSAVEMLDGLRALAAWPTRASELSALSAQIETVAPPRELLDSTQISADSPAPEVIRVEVDSGEREVTTNREGLGAAPTQSRPGLAPAVTATLAALLASSAVGLLVLQVVKHAGTEAEPRAAADGPADTAPGQEGVLVSLIGVPEGSTVHYDGAPVSMNPFRVTSRRTIVPIRVEAPGHEPFVTTIVPSADTTVQVELVPDLAAAPEPVEPAVAASIDDVESPSAPSARPRRGAVEPPVSGIKQSGRNTLYSEKFE